MSSILSLPRTRVYARSIWRQRTIVIPLVLLALMGFFFASARHEFRAAASSAFSADLRWVSFAILCQAIALTLIAVNYRQILARLGHRLSWQFMARAHLRRHAVATLVPFGGPASYVLFARDLAPHGVCGNDAVSAMVLYSAGGQAAFVVFMTGTVGWLALTSNLHVSMIAAMIAVPLAIGWITLLFLALRKGTANLSSLRYVPARVGRLADRLAEHNLTPRDLILPMICSIGVNLTGLGMLVAALHAVGQQPSITSLLLVRLVAQLSSHALPVMQGAGVVEMSMVSAMQQMGVLASPAAAAAILFRCAQFWLPLALGILFFINLPRVWAWMSSTGWLTQAVRRITSRFGFSSSSGTI